jgi:hypothetical protein
MMSKPEPLGGENGDGLLRSFIQVPVKNSNCSRMELW